MTASEGNRNDEIWAADLLGRRPDADFLQSFLVARSKELQERQGGSFVLNIDAQWGAGKTFFLDRLGQQLEGDGHLVATVNAWRDDHLDDPFVAILASIDEVFAPFTKKEASKASKAWNSVKSNATPLLTRVVAGTAKTLVKRYVGEEMDELLSAEEVQDNPLLRDVGSAATDQIVVEIEKVVDAKAQKLIEQFRQQDESIEKFKENLAKAITEVSKSRKLPLFILIDELDRCRPSYAVALLERVKHLFDVPNVVFIFATNNSQLKHAIAGAYGPEFDGFTYLKRFFDRTYLLRTPDVAQLVEAEAASIPIDRMRAPREEPLKFLKEVVASYQMPAREIHHVFDIVRTVGIVWRHEVKIDLVALLPLAIQFSRNGNVDWAEAAQSIPDTCRIMLGYYRDQHYRSVPATTSLREIFEELRRSIVSLDTAMNMSRHGMSKPSDYVYDTISPEWNGKAVDRNQPSVQSEVPGLVAHAGNLVGFEAPAHLSSATDTSR